jgi:hypothetical protein
MVISLRWASKLPCLGFVVPRHKKYELISWICSQTILGNVASETRILLVKVMDWAVESNGSGLMASVLSSDGKAMWVGYDVEETEEDLLDGQEDAMEGVTVDGRSTSINCRRLHAFTRSTEACGESDLCIVFATPFVVDAWILKTSCIYYFACKDVLTLHQSQIGGDGRPKTAGIGSCAAMVMGADMVN